MALTKVTGQVINTSTDVTVGVLTVTNTLAVGGTVSIGGTLTYEDVTNIDSVGLITARNGIIVGSGITLSKDGDVFATGVTTTGSLVSSGAVSGTTGTFSGAVSGTTGTFTGDLTIPDKIVHTGDTDTAIRLGVDTFTVETAGSERIRITSAGNIGIGQNTPTALLHLKSNAPYITFEDDDNNQDWQIQATAWFAIRDQTNSAERLRIDSSGRLLLGTTDIGYTSFADNLTIADSANCGITLRSGTSNQGNIYFSDGTGTGADTYRGYITYAHADNYMLFATNAVERLRITSDGDLSLRSITQNAFLGLTANSTAINFTLGSTSGTSPRMYLYGTGNGQSSAGDIFMGAGTGGILHFRSAESIKLEVNSDSSTTEALRIDSSGRLLVGSTDGATYSDASMDDLIIGSTASGKNDGITILSGTGQNGSIAFADSGGSTQGLVGYVHNGDYLRFHASDTLKARIDTDGLKFNSDTSAANALDDYEEGTFTPTNNVGMTITNHNPAYYIKIGKLVHIQMDITLNGVSDSSQASRIQSLPFTSENVTNHFAQGSIQHISQTGSTAYDNTQGGLLMYIAPNESRIDIVNISSGAIAPRSATQGRRFRISMMYKSA